MRGPDFGVQHLREGLGSAYMVRGLGSRVHGF